MPGQIKGLEYILDKYGRLDWSQVIEPSIEVAQTGFPVSYDMSRAIDYATNLSSSRHSNLSFLQSPSWSPDFAPNGTVVQYGDTITRKRYANTLRIISRDGPSSFYEGYIANVIIKTLNKEGGIITHEDLRNYDLKFREISQVKYRNYTLTSTTAPSSGVVVLVMLGVLGQYERIFSDSSQVNTSSHRMTEAMKFGYASVRTSLVCRKQELTAIISEASWGILTLSIKTLHSCKSICCHKET